MKMFMSRIQYTLPGGDDYLNADLTSYKVHQDMWTFFPDCKKKENGPFLFHIQGSHIIMISSKVPLLPNPLWSLQSREYNPRVDVDQELFFDLKISPNYCTGGKQMPYIKHKTFFAKGAVKDQKKTIIPLLKVWFDERKEQLGFVLGDFDVVSYRFRKVPKPKNPFPFEEIFIRGKLTVTNVDKFITSLYKGVGKRRRNGCGLLLVS